MAIIFKNKLLNIAFALFIINIFLAGIGGLKCKSTYAQHIDVFNLDKSDLPKKVQPDAPETEWIIVEDRISYKVPVEKTKFEGKDIMMEDIELWEVVDKAPFEWHQVDYYIEEHIVETHTRTFGKQKCERIRNGTLFWLKDGRKCVFWSRWKVWDCRTEKQKQDYLNP